MIAGEVGDAGVSDGGAVSAAAGDAAGLLEPDVNRLNMAQRRGRSMTAAAHQPNTARIINNRVCTSRTNDPTTRPLGLVYAYSVTDVSSDTADRHAERLDNGGGRWIQRYQQC